jgi:6-phosphogluconolactonase/glucosamine-6-phosphate isomerase/deaminase
MRFFAKYHLVPGFAPLRMTISLMQKGIAKIFQENAISHHRNHGILIAEVDNEEQGLSFANDLLLQVVDDTSLLLLSGGRTPLALYAMIAEEKKLHPGAVGMVDERYGPKWHENSNEIKLRETGTLDYYQYTGIPVYLVLQQGLSRQETATAYDERLRELFSSFEKKIGILGIGVDGHTAGIPVRNAKFKLQNAKLYSEHLVADYKDSSGIYGERVTMTFTALAQLDLLMVLVFGADKKPALDLVFTEGSEEEIPGRFYTRPEIAKKTLFITDQKF